jgi:hypothetical protein
MAHAVAMTLAVLICKRGGGGAYIYVSSFLASSLAVNRVMVIRNPKVPPSRRVELYLHSPHAVMM